MGGTVNGNSTGSGYWRIQMVWTNTVYDTYVTIGVTVNRYAIKADTSGYDARKDTTTITIDGNSASGTPTWNHSNTKGQVRKLWSRSRNVNRGTSARTITISAKNVHPGSATMSGTSSASTTYSVPARASWAIKYYANGGVGSIADGTKYHSIDVTLSNGEGISREHYTLKGWNTSADGSGTHYNLGQTYSGNAGLTLYAEWELNEVLVKTKVNGTWVDGVVNTKINGTWVKPHTGYVKVNGVWEKL